MNTLTDLYPSLYSGLNTVSREQTGFIPAVHTNATADRAAVGQPVKYHITGAANLSDITPAMTVPEPTDQVVENDQIVITKSRAAEFGFVGEEQLALDNNGAGYSAVQADIFAEAIRGLTNEVETDIAAAAVAGASRAWGTPGTTPFAANAGDFSQIRKILNDNGAPMSERQLVLDSTAGASLATLMQLNQDRDDSRAPFRDQGVMTNRLGFAVRETGQGQLHEKGDAASATTDNAGYAKGATAITLDAAGTGAILAGDVITFAGDPNQYVVAEGLADVSAGGVITLAGPGLREDIAASATAITVGDSYEAAGVGFYRNAIVLASRLPERPREGDMALDVMTMTDPRSGLTFEVAIYGGYRKARFEVSLAWGVKVTQDRHTALLLG